MLEPCIGHLPNITAFFCISIECLGSAEASQCHGITIVVSSITELEGWR